MRKRQQNKRTTHHRKPKSIGGTNEERNISYVRDKEHQAYHLLFSNKTPYEISKILNDTWIDPDYELIVKKKDIKDKNQLELF